MSAAGFSTPVALTPSATVGTDVAVGLFVGIAAGVNVHAGVCSSVKGSALHPAKTTSSTKIAPKTGERVVGFDTIERYLRIVLLGCACRLNTTFLH